MDVSIVIINYNSSSYTINCIASIIKETNNSVSYEVVVVDNDSAPDDRETLKSYIAELDVDNVFMCESIKNVGFAQGNMFGANFASGKYLFLLNNDCILKNSVIEGLFEHMESNIRTGIAVPECYDENGNLVASFGYIPTVMNQWIGVAPCRLFNPSGYPKRKVKYHDAVEVPMVCGAAMFIRRETFNQIGGLDSNFFLYCEEEDLCLRARKAGFAVVHVPNLEVVHVGGGSTVRNEMIEREYYISLFYFLKKHYNLISRVLIRLRFLGREIIRFFRGRRSLSFVLFLVSGAGMNKSIRHLQRCRVIGKDAS